MPTMEDLGRIQAQVGSLEKGYAELRHDVNAVRSDMRTGFDSILSRIDNKTTMQWQPIAILVTVLLAIGGALYMPVREAGTKHEAQIETLRGLVVSRAEHDRMWKDNADDQRRTDDHIRTLWHEHVKLAREHSYLEGRLNPFESKK